MLFWWTKDLSSFYCPHSRGRAGIIPHSRGRAGIRGNFLYLCSLRDLEVISTSKTFQLSTEIAVTTASVDKKPFLCHVRSTETPASAVCSVSRSPAATSDILFFTTCLDGTFIEKDSHHAFFVVGGGMFEKQHNSVSGIWPTPILRKLYTVLTLIFIVSIPLLRSSLVLSIWGEV